MGQIDAKPELKAQLATLNTKVFFYKRPITAGNSKYPSQLQLVKSQAQAKFASFCYDTTQTKIWKAAAIIISILFIVLFPVWPFALKYGIWLLCVGLLVSIIGLTMVRLGIFLIVVIFGWQLWIFPNMFIEPNILDSFKTIYTMEKCQNDTLAIMVRIFAVTSILGLIMTIFIHPDNIEAGVDLAAQAVQGLHDWGWSKINPVSNFSQRAITSLDELINQTIADSAEM